MAAKKTSVKKTGTKKPAAKPATKSLATMKEAMSKSQILMTIAERTELSKKQVQGVLDEINALVEAHVKKNGVGTFTLPGLLKITVIRKPATKARKGINPFTGEETTFKAKPARNVVKVRPLKKLKDMVA